MSELDPRPVGRTRATGEAPSVDPQREILAAASVQFSRVGVAGTTIAAIARGAGLRAPSLYYYFESKQAIVDALVAFSVEVAGEVSEPAFGADLGPRDRLRQLLTAHLDHLLGTDYDLYFLLGPSTSGESADADPEGYSRWRAAVADTVRRGREQGELGDLDPRFALTMIIGCIQGALLGKHLGQSMHASDVADFILAALAP